MSEAGGEEYFQHRPGIDPIEEADVRNTQVDVLRQLSHRVQPFYSRERACACVPVAASAASGSKSPEIPSGSSDMLIIKAASDGQWKAVVGEDGPSLPEAA